MTALERYIATGLNPTGYDSFYPQPEAMNLLQCDALVLLPYNATPTPYKTTLNTLLRVQNFDEAAKLFGTKTAAFRFMAAAFAANQTGAARINTLALPFNAGGAAATYTLTCGGPAAAAHSKTIAFCGRLYYVSIPNGATATAIALLVKAALDADSLMPFTITAAAGVLTLVAVDQGVFYNGLTISVTDSRKCQAITDTTMVLAQTVQGSGSLDTSALAGAVGDCCYRSIGCSGAEDATINTVVDLTDAKRAGGPDWCGVMAYFGRKQSVGTAVTFGAGVAGSCDAWNRVAVGLHVNPAMQFAAAEMAIFRAVQSAAAGCYDPGNPLVNTQGKMTNFPFAGGCNSLFTRSELNQLFGAGWTPVVSIDGYAGIAEERTFYRYDASGNATLAYADPTQLRVLDFFYNQHLKPWLLETYGSVILFKDGTRIQPLNGLPADVPPFMQTRRAITPSLFKGALVAFMRRFVGVIFDEQEFEEKIFAAPDDQLRAFCQGDPRVLAVFFDQISIARPVRQFALQFGFTTRTC
ncbi:MAG: hypothetical protein AB7F96_16445 [Beijerinckiaceae bacterium]